MRSRTFRYAPLVVFGAVYTLSCLLGALLLIAEYDAFVSLFEYFSGTEAPQLSPAQARTNLLLLIAAPLALAAGYVACIQLPARQLASQRPRRRTTIEPPHWLPAIAFAVLALIGFASLVRAGALGRTQSWLDYGAWVESRSENFARLTFFEFVNLYILVPSAAAWVLISTVPATRTQALLRLIPIPITVALSLLLFTRKAVLTAVLIVLFAWMIDAVARGRAVRKLIFSGVALFAALYVALVAVPVYSEASRTTDEAARATASTDPEQERRLAEIGEAFNLENRRRALVIYSVLSPLTRSSAPALYYPIVFPKEHEYFRLDVGLDIIGFGSMPDDNIVVWNHLNPDTPGGTTMVSYQFVLFSQIGTLGAIAASLAVGFLLALAWRLSQIPARATSALLGSMVLLLATYLAIDSLRNSVVVSYGVIWGLLFAAATAALVRFARPAHVVESMRLPTRSRKRLEAERGHR
jgi:hypothetical protein